MLTENDTYSCTLSVFKLVYDIWIPTLWFSSPSILKLYDRFSLWNDFVKMKVKLATTTEILFVMPSFWLIFIIMLFSFVFGKSSIKSCIACDNSSTVRLFSPLISAIIEIILLSIIVSFFKVSNVWI